MVWACLAFSEGGQVACAERAKTMMARKTNRVIKQIMEWFRTILSKLTDLLPRRQEPEVEPHVDTALDRKLGRDIKKQRERGVGRLLDTRHGGPNMPKYQPCGICLNWVKRVEKTSRGAKYHCNKCNNDIHELAR